MNNFEEWLKETHLNEFIEHAHIYSLDRDTVIRLAHAIRNKVLHEAIEEVKDVISKHNARILNEFQNQGKSDMPLIAYDERICLIPAMEIATKQTKEIIESSLLNLLTKK